MLPSSLTLSLSFSCFLFVFMCLYMNCMEVTGSSFPTPQIHLNHHRLWPKSLAFCIM